MSRLVRFAFVIVLLPIGVVPAASASSYFECKLTAVVGSVGARCSRPARPRSPGRSRSPSRRRGTGTSSLAPSRARSRCRSRPPEYARRTRQAGRPRQESPNRRHSRHHLPASLARRGTHPSQLVDLTWRRERPGVTLTSKNPSGLEQWSSLTQPADTLVISVALTARLFMAFALGRPSRFASRVRNRTLRTCRLRVLYAP